MGATNAYSCDGPKCDRLISREPRKQGAPPEWIRLSLTPPGGDTIHGSFHDAECAHAWVNDLLDIEPERIDKAPHAPHARDEG